MTTRILIMGLPGAGKTTLAKYLLDQLQNSGRSVSWFNADEIRKKWDDWDFSEAGRVRQSNRMRELSDSCGTDYAICDFVAPLEVMRDNFEADWTIWLDTIEQGRYDDTNKMFVKPVQYDFRINEKEAEKWSAIISDCIQKGIRRPVFDWKKETVQMLGRWQPWHQGHRALFERALEKTGQVVIQIRDCQGWNGSNPFAISEVEYYIRRDLDPMYQGRYEIQVVPNIVHITYGRDVGYKIEKEEFDPTITDISATKIRKAMGLE
jgi:hypothetical protein